MNKRSRFTVLVATVAIILGLALPAIAQGPTHKSCKGFGEIFALFAQNPELFGWDTAGEGIAWNARFGLDFFGDGSVVFTPPGSVADTVHFEQTLFCEPF